ncbi:hypothetical protein KP77_24930 [Jeotgalibacillus alimentarius]|uniref:Apea-like HEPN domain-containing protein n=1 Tax=Jeotgalibacillus alimentarius TaxID=135826 RepID=A0A0C2R9B8_9BACL|nr:hypothetical protein [Jeotgalibacillus alimentarius]KIL46925.1 hypothetical protein KP77_24930 [Jeotgalibacillus alimentarius]
MEHRKLIALSVKCNECSRGWSASAEEFEKLDLKCQDPECNNTFSVYEGIRNSLKDKEEQFMPNTLLANDMYNGTVSLKMGYSKYIELPQGIQKVFKVQLIPMGPFQIGAVDITANGFNVLTSFIEGSEEPKLGEEIMSFYIVNAKKDDYEEPWLHLLSSSLDHLRSKEYLTSIILSEIALESFIDKTISNEYLRIGLDEDSISRLMVSANIPTKVNPLMYNLFGFKLSSFKETHRNWQERVLIWRNEIAHGSKAKATSEEAQLSFDTVVDAIFQLIESIERSRKN